jgi:hypothetical protein
LFRCLEEARKAALVSARELVADNIKGAVSTPLAAAVIITNKKRVGTYENSCERDFAGTFEEVGQKFNLPADLLAAFSVSMETQIRTRPTSPCCLKCGNEPRFITSILDPRTGRTFRMFECECGDRTWISEKT